MARAKTKKVKEEVKEAPIEAVLAKHTDLDLAEMPLETYDDYVKYNAEARRLNKKFRECRYPPMQCPVELHPTQKIVFMRKDQPRNPLKVKRCTALLDYEETLIPGQTYDMPVEVVDWLAKKGTPIWDYIEKPGAKAGETKKETIQVGTDPRFALRQAM